MKRKTITIYSMEISFKNFTVTRRLKMDWNYASGFSVCLWFKLSSYIWQSDSERCSKTSLREIHAAAQWQNLASRLKRSWSVNAKSRHAVLLKQMTSITFTASCPEQLAWNCGFHSLFWSCSNQYSQYLQILMDYIKIWDYSTYIPFKAGHEMWWACFSIPSKHSKIKLVTASKMGQAAQVLINNKIKKTSPKCWSREAVVAPAVRNSPEHSHN